MKLLKAALTVSLTALVVGCAGAGVRQQVLDAWVGMPVLALDTHSYFKTLPMSRTITEGGIEVRDYQEEIGYTACWIFHDEYFILNQSFIRNCLVGADFCNHIFYIKDWTVIKYAPTGQCYTDKTVQPEAPYLRVRGGPYKFQPNYYR